MSHDIYSPLPLCDRPFPGFCFKIRFLNSFCPAVADVTNVKFFLKGEISKKILLSELLRFDMSGMARTENWFKYSKGRVKQYKFLIISKSKKSNYS